jgi:hypothetical protein
MADQYRFTRPTLRVPADVTPPNPPVITSVQPTSGIIGTTVTLYGTNLAPVDRITFGEVEATVISESATAVTVRVPQGLAVGILTITLDNVNGHDTVTFTVAAAPQPETPVVVDSLLDLIGAVRERVGDFTELHTLAFTGNGQKRRFRLRRNLDEYSLVVTIDGEAAEPIAVDLLSGWITVDPAPASSSVVLCEFAYHKFSMSRVVEAINDALPPLFPQFYLHGADESMTTNGDELEYPLPRRCEVPTHLDLYKSGRWVEVFNWDLVEKEDNPGVEVIHFRSSPGSYRMRVRYVARPYLRFEKGDDLLSDVGLPGAARNPIVLWAGYQLLHGKIGADEVAEARSLRSQKTTIDATNAFLQAFMIAKQAVAMQPWSSSMTVSYG